MKKRLAWYIVSILIFCSCKKSSNPPSESPTDYTLNAVTVNGISNGFDYTNVSTTPVIKLSFSAPVQSSSVSNNITFKNNDGLAIAFTPSFENSNSTVLIQPSKPLNAFSRYIVAISNNLLSEKGGKLSYPISITLTTFIDSTDKFPRISDNNLLDLVQKQTFKYFWDFGHPVSGLARERNSSGDVVTTGGSGFGIMAIIVAVNRNFITRAEGLSRLQKIVGFLKNNAQTFHGAYPHWMNGATGAVVPFSTKDNGADLVETSFLLQGLLCARQYFDATDATETALRNDINTIWKRVEWNWFRKGNENVLYWHWSPNYNWDMNMPIKGWNEALITYVLAASSPDYSIPKDVYDNGWAGNGAMKNGNSYYNILLPLGPPYGGPLFFAHYSFLGINPTSLTDAYANYWEQNKAHTLINYTYCKTNPKNFSGYSDACWGLTASDDNKSGYLAHEPMNDDGVISPTAALSSFPYTPQESMKALQFFYYTLGDKLWKEYGFVDAFNLTDAWFADSFLAIDQGPIIVMVENYRSGLLWNLFMSCPEVKIGMKTLGFSSPNL